MQQNLMNWQEVLLGTSRQSPNCHSISQHLKGAAHCSLNTQCWGGVHAQSSPWPTVRRYQWGNTQPQMLSIPFFSLTWIPLRCPLTGTGCYFPEPKQSGIFVRVLFSPPSLCHPDRSLSDHITNEIPKKNKHLHFPHPPLPTSTLYAFSALSILRLC